MRRNEARRPGRRFAPSGHARSVRPRPRHCM